MKKETESLIIEILKVPMWIVISIAIIIAVFILSTYFRNKLEEPEGIGGQYAVVYVNRITLGVAYDGKSCEVYDEKMYMDTWKTSDDYVLIHSWNAPKEMPQNEADDVFFTDDALKIAKAFTSSYYIIEKKKDKIFGPMNIKEYAEMRDSLGVPDDVRLKIKMKL